MKNINLESNSSSMVNISHEILFVLRCLAYFWNSATLRELSKCILYQIHTEFFLIVEFSGPPNLAGQKDLLKTGESSNLAGRRIYRAMTVYSSHGHGNRDPGIVFVFAAQPHYDGEIVA